MFGDYDSPVILMMTYTPSFLLLLSSILLTEGVAIVTVGFPVTPLLLSRIRFCISAGHSIEELEKAIQKISVVGRAMRIDYAKAANYISYTQHLSKQDIAAKH